MSQQLTPLHELSIRAAKARRWRTGREVRGLSIGEPFDGVPLHELFEELIDSLNYLDAYFKCKPGDLLMRMAAQRVEEAATITKERLRAP